MKIYYLLRMASWLAGWVPSRFAYRVCSLVGGIVFWVRPSIRHDIMDNMSHILPKSTSRQRRNIARRVIRNNFKNYYDLIRIPHMTKEYLFRTVKVVGLENLDAAFALGKGAIIIGGHIGNFNIVPQAAKIRGYPIVAVDEDIKPRQLYNYLNRLRSHFGLRFIGTNSSEIRTIYKLLRNNNALILAIDRDVAGSREPVLLFDELADLPPGPVALALRLDAALVPVHAVRLRDNTSIVHIYPAIPLERTGDKEKDLKINLRKAAQALEEMILKAPDQWVVLQRVWDRPEDRGSGVGGRGRESKWTLV